MHRLLLVVAPRVDQADALLDAVRGLEPQQLWLAHSLDEGSAQTASAVAAGLGLTAVADERFDAGPSAIELLRAVATDGSDADGSEPVAVVIASEAVIRAIVVHALEAPVPPDRLRFDAGAIAEVELRHDAPWTVNRLNDGCHLDGVHVI